MDGAGAAAGGESAPGRWRWEGLTLSRPPSDRQSAHKRETVAVNMAQGQRGPWGKPHNHHRLLLPPTAASPSHLGEEESVIV